AHRALDRSADRQVSRPRHRRDGAWRHDPRRAGACLRHASRSGGAVRDRERVDHVDRAFRVRRSGARLEGRLHQLHAARDRGRPSRRRQQGMKSKEELAADQATYWNGTGGQMAELARAVGAGGHVMGVDISEPLVEAARAQGLANARFEVGDATTFPFEAQSFDLVFSRFGVMFFGDPVAAFTNMRRALKPGGRLVFLCWRPPAENPWAAVPMRAAQPFLPPIERPGPEEPGQYSFGDRARVERILTQAGFTGLSIEPVDQMLNQGRDIPAVMKNIGDFGPLAR